MPYQTVKTFSGEKKKLGTFVPGLQSLFVYKKDNKWFLVHIKSQEAIGFYKDQETAYNVGRFIKYNIPESLEMSTKQELKDFITLEVPFEVKEYIQRPYGLPYVVYDDTPPEVFQERINKLITALRSDSYKETFTCLHFVNRDTNEHFFEWEGIACDIYQKDKNDLKVEVKDKIYFYDDFSGHMPPKVLKYFNFRDNSFYYKNQEGEITSIKSRLNFNQIADILEQKPYGLFRKIK